MRSPLKIACLQLNSQQAVADNLATVIRLCKQAKNNDAVQAVALPENAFCHPFDSSLAEVLTGILDDLRRLAQELGIWIFAGTLPEADGQGKFRAAFHAINDHGEDIACYHKMHLFDVHIAEENLDYHESGTFSAGQQPVVVETPWGDVGLAVCYDLRFPEFFLSVEPRQPLFWIIPSAFTFHTGEKHWQHLLSARAVDNFAWFVAPNQCGLHPGGRRTWGHSAIVNPDGGITASCAEGTGYCVATLDARVGKQRRFHIPLIQHRRFAIVPRQG